MQLVCSIAEVRQAVAAARAAGKRIGFVPTMGYLHEGHLTLMRRARQESDFVVVSIFVNPTQFGPNEDFARYPRDIERDKALCASVPVDLIFHPDVSEMYPQPYRTTVRVSGLTDTLCGASRPGHFDGVATVVTKLFNIVKPDLAFFGQKDAQQVAVIQRMAADLNMDLQIIPVPTVREPDGLAMSSRNTYLSPEERQAALVLSRSLRMAQERVREGERDMAALQAAMRAMIAAEPLADIDYVSIVDHATLQPVERLEGRALAAVAVRFGKTRLIDNVILEL
ncbi:MAG: pantoate--beta-alanine ligase [Bacillota bacterium]